MSHALLILGFAGWLVFPPAGGVSQKVSVWTTQSFRISFGLQVTGTCDDRECNGGVKSLHFWAQTDPFTLTGRTEGGRTNCAFADSPVKDLMLKGTPGLGLLAAHVKGKAKITSYELCKYYNGKEHETQKIISRSDDFSVALKVLRYEEAMSILGMSVKAGPDSVPIVPLAEVVWLMLEATTPFSKPALSWGNSDGSVVTDTFRIVFSVGADALLKGTDVTLTVPDPFASKCEKGEWSIWFMPEPKKK